MVEEVKTSSLAQGSSDKTLKRIEKMLTSLIADVTILKADVSTLKVEVENQRDFQVDQERERHSLLLSANAAARGSLPYREPHLSLSGTRFVTTRRDLKPASIY